MQVPRFGIFNATLEVMTQASIQIAESGAQQRADDLLRQLGQKMRDQQLKDKQQQSHPQPRIKAFSITDPSRVALVSTSRLYSCPASCPSG